MSLADLASSAANIIPPEQRDRFARTGFGTLLGQTLLTVLTIAAIAACIGFIYARFHETFPDLFSNPWFWALLFSLFAVVFVFQVLPTAIQGWRERKLRRLTITHSAHLPGAFLLHPYGFDDADRYDRPDGADDAAIRWLERSDRTLLYLFGASGAGKSSLIAAGMLPRLKERGWDWLMVRVYDDPADQLRAALVARKERLQTEPATPIRGLLERASQERIRAGLRPLLVVIDQFEEFLILSSEEARAPLLSLLHSLEQSPLPGLRLLCVFRSDYRELLFKLGLPSYVVGTNAFELAPFLRTEAEAFLRKGGRELSAEGYAALFAGLDRIEETRGSYRPITLNMIGLILERMGNRLAGSPDRLMEAYLRDCLARGTSQDFAAPVLSSMITASGTKEPRDLGGIAATTRLQPWQVASTLADLERHGLVRPLDAPRARWEISHDFLARQIGILLGRMRAPWIRRAAPLAVPAAALGWAAAMFLLLMWWPGEQERRAVAELREMGVVQIMSPDPAFPGEWLVTVRDDVNSEQLARLGELYTKLRRPPTQLGVTGAFTSLGPLQGMTALSSLDLANADGITSLEPLKGMTALTSLNLAGADGITSLEPLRGLTALTSLNLANADGVTSLGPLQGMIALSSLDLANADGITSLEPLKGMTALTSLKLAGADGITSLEPLKGMTALTSLNLSDADGVTSLEPLKGLTALTSLNLSDADGITSLEPLTGMTALTSLNLANTNGIPSLEPLTGLTALISLNLFDANGITSIEAQKGLTAFTSLNLSDANGITSLEPLKGMTALTSLNLANANGITSLEPLKGVTALTSLNLSFADGITSLEPLKGLTALSSLDLTFARGITSLEPLKGLTALTSLNLSDADGITSLEPLKGLTALTMLDLTRADGITSLEPLKGISPSAIQASDALMATLPR